MYGALHMCKLDAHTCSFTYACNPLGEQVGHKNIRVNLRIQFSMFASWAHRHV